MMKKTNVIIALLFMGWCYAHFAATPWLAQQERDFIREVEKREPATFPAVNQYADLINRFIYQLASEALTDRLAFRSRLIMAKRNMDYFIFQCRDYAFVDIGKAGWFFIRDAYFIKNETPQWVAHVLGRIDNFLKKYPANEPELLLVIPPDKHAIYPEMLSVQSEKYIIRGNHRSETLRRHFEKNPFERVLPLWGAYAQGKRTAAEKIFYQTDTHHTPAGSLIMCREIVERLYPGIWQADEVVDNGEDFFCGDLTLMIGMNRRKELRHLIDIRRANVEKTSMENLEPELAVNGLLRYVSKSSGPPMITGKTLFLHDSMVAYSRETLRQFFTDITFVHYDRISSEGQFETFAQGYDRIILEIGERMVLQTMESLLDNYHFKKMYELDQADLPYISFNDETTMARQADGMHVRALGTNPMIYLPAQHLDYSGEYQLSVVMDSAINTESQLYYQDSRHRTFGEQRSLRKPVKIGKNYLNFNLPAESLYYKKRFDPSMQPGNFVIHTFSLRRLAEQEENSGKDFMLRKNSIRPILVTGEQKLVLPAWDPMAAGNPTTQCKLVPGGMLIDAEKNDPYFLLPPLSGDFAGSKPRLILALEVPAGSSCQVFYKHSGMEKYAEQKSKQKLVTTGFNQLNFELEPEVLAYPLRIDPGTGKGRYFIHAARIEGLGMDQQHLVASKQTKAKDSQAAIAYMIYPSIPIKALSPQQLGKNIVPKNEVVIRETPKAVELNALGPNSYVYLSPQLKRIEPGYYKILINLQSFRKTSAQLFWREKGESDYSEAQSQQVRVETGENLFEFLVTAEAFEKPLRFDMASHAGRYQLQGMVIERITLSGEDEENRRQHVPK